MFGYCLRYSLTHPHRILGMALKEIKWAWQRVYRGWDDKALWGLDYWLIEKMLEMLPAFGDKPGIPNQCFDVESRGNPTDAEVDKAKMKWDGIVQQMIDGFEAGKEMVDLEFKVDYDDSHERYHAGMKVFNEHLFSLWY